MYYEITFDGKTYTRQTVSGWTREQMRPMAKAIALQRNDGVNRTALWNAAAEIQREYIFEGKHPQANGDAPVTMPQANGEHHGNGDSENALFDILARGLQGKIQAGLSEAAIAERLAEIEARLLAANEAREKVTRVVLEKGPGEEPRDLGIQHKRFPLLLKEASILCKGKHHNIALVGPAGTGKTYSAHALSVALGLTFRAMSVGPQTTQSQLMGYMDASGKYVTTALREAFETGGVILLDEMDAAHPGVLTCINALTANSGAGFPDGKYVMRHPDFIVIVGMNTYGNGADSGYVGRNQLDDATKSRFAMIPWDQDDALEASLCGNEDWCVYVQRVRAAIAKVQVRHIVSPRASYDGAESLAAGIDRESVEEMHVWKGLKATEKAKVLAAMA